MAKGVETYVETQGIASVLRRDARPCVCTVFKKETGDAVNIAGFGYPLYNFELSKGIVFPVFQSKKHS